MVYDRGLTIVGIGPFTTGVILLPGKLVWKKVDKNWLEIGVWKEGLVKVKFNKIKKIPDGENIWKFWRVSKQLIKFK